MAVTIESWIEDEWASLLSTLLDATAAVGKAEHGVAEAGEASGEATGQVKARQEFVRFVGDLVEEHGTSATFVLFPQSPDDMDVTPEQQEKAEGLHAQGNYEALFPWDVALGEVQALYEQVGVAGGLAEAILGPAEAFLDTAVADMQAARVAVDEFLWNPYQVLADAGKTAEMLPKRQRDRFNAGVDGDRDDAMSKLIGSMRTELRDELMAVPEYDSRGFLQRVADRVSGWFEAYEDERGPGPSRSWELEAASIERRESELEEARQAWRTHEVSVGDRPFHSEVREDFTAEAPVVTDDSAVSTAEPAAAGVTVEWPTGAPPSVTAVVSPNDVDEASQVGESPNLAEVQERFPTLTLHAQQMIAAGVDDGLYTMEEAQAAMDGFAGWATDGDGDLAEEGGPPGAPGPWGDGAEDGDGAEGGDGADPPLPGLTEDDIKNLAFGQGYGARFLAIRSGNPNEPDIGDVLLQAAAEGWYESEVGIARLTVAITQTPWFIARSAAQRQFEMLESTDLGEATAQLDKKADEIQRVINRLGLGAHTEITSRIRDMARDAIYENWTAYDINQNVLMEADWAEGQAGGAVGSNYRAIDTKAADYMVGHLITDTDRDGWAEDLYLGDIDEAWLNNHMADLAMQTWTGMADRIKQGYTVKQIVSPLRQEAARWLERDITDRDFLDNPDFARILNYPQDDGLSRLMTVGEVGEYVRKLDEWQTTGNAKRSARSLANLIGKKFGRAA